MTLVNVRATYIDASVSTADPGALLVMLCDRLVLDLRRGGEALQARDLPAAHDQLVHAQAIVLELRTSLRPELFPGGEQLGAIYDHLHRTLVTANVHKDADAVAGCLDLAQAIADTWREAALIAGRAS